MLKRKLPTPAEIGRATRLENFKRHWQATAKFYSEQHVEIKRDRLRDGVPPVTKKLTSRRRKMAPTTPPDPRQARAAMLDRLADQQLQAGFHHQAERLAHQAAEMRAVAR